jgi:prophage antirepressor-like protein
MSAHKKAPSVGAQGAFGNVVNYQENDVMQNSIAISEENNAQQSAQVFQFQKSSDVRVQMIAGEPWFYAVDVCASIALADTNKALIGLDDDEKCEHEQYSGSGRKPMLINESGLYSLILRSRKPEAKAFKKWVTSEVLPSIRKTGAYIHAPAMRPSLTKEHSAEMHNLVNRIGWGWALSDDSKNWIFNHIRVAFNVARFEDVPDDQFEELMRLLWSKEEAKSQFVRFLLEARTWFEKEVLGGGQPWTPTIKSKLTRQLKRQVILPPIVDWIALSKQVSPVAKKDAA